MSKKEKWEIRTLLVRTGMIALLLFLFTCVIFGVAISPDEDMKPGIGAGDLVLFYRLSGSYTSQDVVVYRMAGKSRIGRIVAVPGDKVEVTEEGELMINDSPVVENNANGMTFPYDAEVQYPLTLGKEEYFVLSDQREGGKDSRYYGAITKELLKGKIMTVIRSQNI